MFSNSSVCRCACPELRGSVSLHECQLREEHLQQLGGHVRFIDPMADFIRALFVRLLVQARV